ncbi:MAG: DUF2207 domain-containing protein [Fusobacterium periodonticum]|nr:DUF2207 domain-containing protein [Fusobacterium periodonticum]
MKKNILRIFLFFLISIVSFAASFRIEKLDIEANLQKDGSMVVSEAVTYDIDEINGVYFDIDAKGFGELQYIQVFEDDSTGGFKEVDSSNYEVSVSDELYRIKLYSKNHNNRRTFKFVYKLPEAITVYDDVAQFNRKMVGQEWQQGINYITAKVIIPVSASYDNSNILVFGHGPLTGEVDKEGNTVIYKLNNYYPGDFLEAHILMEPEIFSEYNKSKIVHKDMKQKLLDMEAKLADEANAERDKARRQPNKFKKLFGKQGLMLGVLVSIWGALIFYIYGIYRRKNRVKNSVGKYLRELPDDSSPALVGSFMTDSIGGNEILATIVDLIRRKILRLETSEEKSIITLVGNTEKLSAQERVIVDIYINDFGDGKSLDLKSFGFFQKVPMSVARKFEKWRAMVQSEMDRKNLTYQGLGCLGVIFFAFFPMIFTFAGLVIGMITGNKMFLLIVVMGIILFVSGAKARYPRKELAEAKDKWQAFKNFLSDYSQLEEAKITSVHLWEQYFVYAVALGVSEKVVKAYKKALDMGVINDVQGVNSLAYSPIFNPMFSRSFSNLNGMVSRTNSGASSAIASSRRSSSSGGGGGFSSRSSGGGGSRGGGGAF